MYLLISIQSSTIFDRVNIMVNIFGKEEVRGKSGPRGATGVAGARGPAGEQGPSGVRGERGKAGASGMKDLYSWLGDTTLRDFRRDSEDCSLVIWKEDDDEGTKDLKGNKEGEIVEWISRSISTISGGKRRFRKNAKLLSSTAHPSLHFKYENGYLEMQKTIFKVSDASLTDTYSSLCVTFKVKEQTKEEVQYIVSNWEEPGGIPYVTRGITASAKEIHVLGSNHLTIAHDCTPPFWWSGIASLAVDIMLIMDRKEVSLLHKILERFSMIVYTSVENLTLHSFSKHLFQVLNGVPVRICPTRNHSFLAASNS